MLSNRLILWALVLAVVAEGIFCAVDHAFGAVSYADDGQGGNALGAFFVCFHFLAFPIAAFLSSVIPFFAVVMAVGATQLFVLFLLIAGFCTSPCPPRKGNRV